MSVEYRLQLDLKSYWRPGSGKGSGSHVDAVVEKDRFGCPFISGRMLKGLLRDALYRIVHWNSGGYKSMPAAESVVETLFGSWAFENNRPRNETRPGVIRISDAVMEDEVRQWLSLNPEYRQALFNDIYSTAIDSTKGIARRGSLRGEQVAIPMMLNAVLELDDGVMNLRKESSDFAWILANGAKLIEDACSLVKAVGAGRTRGLGRVEIKLITLESER